MPRFAQRGLEGSVWNQSDEFDTNMGPRRLEWWMTYGRQTEDSKISRQDWRRRGQGRPGVLGRGDDSLAAGNLMTLSGDCHLRRWFRSASGGQIQSRRLSVPSAYPPNLSTPATDYAKQHQGEQHSGTGWCPLLLQL
ncbi:hypothetical protein CPC08DRAFT_717751 [Agrocybe pediades]|nr:hypothetical protein CPC08DRAFT_717751 [Agrocybe pediades]